MAVATCAGVALPAAPAIGLSFLGSPAASSERLSQTENTTAYRVANSSGHAALVRLTTMAHVITLTVTLENGQTGNISMRTGSPGPAYGLGDHGGWEKNANVAATQKTYAIQHNGPPLLHNNYDKTNLMNIYLPQGRWILFDTGDIFEGPQTLTDFDMPLDQPPVFVGGKGILLLRDPKDDHLYAEVYSVSKEDQKASFHLKDGENAIIIENRLKGNGITNAFVRDETNGKTIPHRLDEKRKAVVFIPEVNRIYTVFCN